MEMLEEFEIWRYLSRALRHLPPVAAVAVAAAVRRKSRR